MSQPSAQGAAGNNSGAVNFNPNNAPITPGLPSGMASALASLPTSTQQQIANGSMSMAQAFPNYSGLTSDNQSIYQGMLTDPRGAAAQQHDAEIASRLASLPQGTGPANPNMPDASLAQTNPDLYIAQYQQAQQQGSPYFQAQPFLQAAATGANALQAYNNSAFGQYNNSLPAAQGGYSTRIGAPMSAPQQSNPLTGLLGMLSGYQQQRPNYQNYYNPQNPGMWSPFAWQGSP